MARVDAVLNLICSLNGECAIAVCSHCAEGTLSLNADARKKRIRNFCEFANAVADLTIIISSSIVFFAQVFVDLELSLVSQSN